MKEVIEKPTELKATSNRIRELTKAAKLSREELAERLDTSPTQLWRLETGERSLTQDWMKRIAKELGCSPASLISDTEPLMVEVVGYIESGKVVFYNDNLKRKVEAPQGTAPNSEFLDGEPLHPGLKKKWLYAYIPEEEKKNISKLIDELCVVKIKNQEGLFIRAINPGYIEGRFNLIDERGKPTENVDVEWASKAKPIF